MSNEPAQERYRATMTHRGSWYIVDNKTQSVMFAPTEDHAKQRARRLNEIGAGSLFDDVGKAGAAT